LVVENYNEWLEDGPKTSTFFDKEIEDHDIRLVDWIFNPDITTVGISTHASD